MTANSVRTICVREARRQGKSQAFIEAMLQRLAERYDLDGSPPPIAGSALMIVAKLSHCVQWPEED